MENPIRTLPQFYSLKKYKYTGIRNLQCSCSTFPTFSKTFNTFNIQFGRYIYINYINEMFRAYFVKLNKSIWCIIFYSMLYNSAILVIYVILRSLKLKMVHGKRIPYLDSTRTKIFIYIRQCFRAYYVYFCPCTFNFSLVCLPTVLSENSNRYMISMCNQAHILENNSWL